MRQWIRSALVQIFFVHPEVSKQASVSNTGLPHWGRVTHICIGNLTIIGSDNGLSPGRRQAIIWNNADLLSIGHLGTKFNEILIEILTFAFKKLRLKMSSAKWRPFCPGWDGLISHAYLVPAPCITCTVIIYVFVVVNFDALAQASDFRIERRQVVFLCWEQDSNPGGLWNPIFSRLNACWQTDWAIEDQAKKLELDSSSLWSASIQPTWPHCHLAFAPGSGDIHICCC